MEREIELKKHAQLTFHPLSKMITYLQVGILFYSFQLDFGWLKYITVCIGALFIYFGLRIVRQAHPYFKIAYILSGISAILQIVSLTILASPFYQYAEYLKYSAIAILYMMIYLIYLSLKKYSQDKQSIKQFINAYFLMQIFGFVGVVLGDIWIFIFMALFVASFVVLIVALSAIKKDILSHQYLLKLAPVKYDAWFVTLMYILVICVGIGSGFLVGTSFAYQNDQNNSYYTDYTGMGKSEEKVIEKDNLKLKVKYTIYDDEQRGVYLHIIDYEWLKFPVYTFMSNITLYRNSEGVGLVPQQPLYGIVYNDDMIYATSLDDKMNNNFLGNESVAQMNTYINPWNHQIKGQIVYLVDHRWKDHSIEYPITFGLKNHPELPYNEQSNQQIEIFVLAQNQTIERWNYQ